jgi:hypothetical protein
MIRRVILKTKLIISSPKNLDLQGFIGIKIKSSFFILLFLIFKYLKNS